MNSLVWLKPSKQKFKPDDHSKLEPLLPIPNRTVKRLRADDSADSRVKVGHRQAINSKLTPSLSRVEGFCFWVIQYPARSCDDASGD